MGNMKKDYNVNIPKELEKAVFSDIFRVEVNETDFMIDFGLLNSKNKEEINLVSRVAISTEGLKVLIASLFNAGRVYQDIYKKEIGFSINNDESNK